MSLLAIVYTICAIEVSGQSLNATNSTQLQKISPRQFVENHQDFQDTKLEEDYIVVVSFEQLPTEVMLTTLNQAGIELLNFHSKKSYLAKVPTSVKVEQLENNRIVTLRKYNVIEKLSPDLKSNQLPTWAIKSTGTIDVAIMLINNTTTHRQQFIDEFNITNIQSSLKGGAIIIGRVEQDDLVNIAASPMVAHIDAIEPEVQPFNQENRAIQKVNILQASTLGGRDLQGEGIVCGVGDGGELGDHIDFNGRVINYANGTYGSFGAHGDHVSGIVGCAGNLNPIHKGMAPASTLLIQKTTSIVNNAQAYYDDHEMVMTNNSYGVGYNCESNGTYNYSSNNLDWQSREMPGLLHVFAAGNNGFSTCGNYPTGFRSVLRYYQSAKNVLTVGNVKEDQTLNVGSSKGPVSDGRIKPEICGVGTNVNSTGASYNYFVGSGTSMASPSVVGTMALVNERYRQLNNDEIPSGALMKAIACNTADDLGNPGPDYSYGFGLINGLRAVECLENNNYDSDDISNGDTKTFNFTVPASAGELKVMLYWHDKEAPAYAPKALINDLDLKVTAPNGDDYLPWVLNSDTLHVDDIAIRKIDTLNNIEQVTIDNPTAGTYTITVNGTSVPEGPQEFYIVYESVNAEVKLTYPFGGESFQPATHQFIQWQTDVNNSNDFKIEYSLDGGNNWIEIANNVENNKRSYAWNIPNVTTENGFIKISKIGISDSDANIISFSILNQPTNLQAVAICEGHLDLTWDAITEATSYEIFRMNDIEMEVIDTVFTNLYSTGSLTVGDEFWYAVRGITTNGNKTERSIAEKMIPQAGGACPWNFDIKLKEIIIAEKRGRAHTSLSLGNTETISIVVKNLGINNLDGFDMKYKINNGVAVTQTVNESILSGDSLLVTFNTSADFSNGGTYIVNAYVEINEDTDNTNNQIVGQTVITQLANEPIILPYEKDFESLTPSSFKEHTIGLDGIEEWDFMPDANGLLGFIQESTNKCLETNSFSNNSTTEGITFTLNMTNYVSADDVKLNFDYKYEFMDITGSGDYLYIRGSDTDDWIQIEEFFTYGHWVNSENEISTILANNNQSFSSSFQVHFSQGRNTGYAIDNFSIRSLMPLPMELSSFTAHKDGNDVVLNWSTASEFNNDKFEIEVAEEPLPLDNDNFKRIGTVFGNGTTTTNQNYTFTDFTPLKSGHRYYRLKQFDLDGTFTYTDLRVVDFEINNQVTVFPNPFENEINVWNLREDMQLTNIQVMNSIGQIVYDSYNIQNTEQLLINMEDDIPAGMYFLRLISNEETQTFPILKKEQ